MKIGTMLGIGQLVDSGLNMVNAEIDRQYNAEQARIQREWEENMSNTAYQRQVADMKKAGLNPYISMSGGSGASVPSGASATHSTPPMHNIANFVNAILNSKTARDVALLRSFEPTADRYLNTAIGFAAKK